MRLILVPLPQRAVDLRCGGGGGVCAIEDALELVHKEVWLKHSSPGVHAVQDHILRLTEGEGLATRHATRVHDEGIVSARRSVGTVPHPPRPHAARTGECGRRTERGKARSRRRGRGGGGTCPHAPPPRSRSTSSSSRSPRTQAGPQWPSTATRRKHGLPARPTHLAVGWKSATATQGSGCSSLTRRRAPSSARSA